MKRFFTVCTRTPSEPGYPQPRAKGAVANRSLPITAPRRENTPVRMASVVALVAVVD